MADLELLGGHVQIVAELHERLKKICAGDADASKVVVLHGGAGCGKSRIIREFYSQLQRKQPEPLFWPELEQDVVADSSRIEIPEATRKVIGPNLDSFVWPAEALPSFGWWAFNCERLTGAGALASIVSEASISVKRLLPPLIEARLRSQSRWESVTSKFPEALKWLRDATADELGGAALDKLQEMLNFAVPGAGSLVTLVWDLGKAAKHRADAVDNFHQAVDLGPQLQGDRNKLARDVASTICSVASSDIPAIVVVEDAHWMNDDMYSLVSQLADPSNETPVMVILTAWPEGDKGGKWDTWLNKYIESKRAAFYDVPTLDESDLMVLLRHYAPHTSDRDAKLIVDKFSVPLALKIWLTLPSIREQIAQNAGCLEATDELLSLIPEHLKDLYARRWKELQKNVCLALMTAVSLTPNEVSTPSYLREVVVRVVEQLEQEVFTSTDILDGLCKAADPEAWAVENFGVDTIRESFMTDTIRLNAKDLFLNAKRKRMKSICIKVLREVIREHREDKIYLDNSHEAVAASEWLLSLTGESIQCEEDLRAAVACGLRHGREYRYFAAAQFFEAALKYASSNLDQESQIEIAVLRANALKNLGRYKEAYDLYEMICEYRREILGLEHSDTLRAMNNFAFLCRKLCYWLEAYDTYDAILSVQRKLLGDNDRDTLKTEYNLAGLLLDEGWGHYFDGVYAESRRLNEAVSAYQNVLDDQCSILGCKDPDVLSTMCNLARVFGKLRRFDDAISLYETVLDVQRTDLGVEHHDTLSTMHSLAVMYVEVDRSDDALKMLKEVSETWCNLLGDEDPATLRAKNDLASVYRKIGQPEIAVEMCNSLIDIQRRVFNSVDEYYYGADNPVTLLTMYTLARALDDVGKLKDAVEIYEYVQNLQCCHLNDEHPDTLRTSNDLVSAYRRLRRFDEAFRLAQSTVKSCRNVFGENHPDTLVAIQNLAEIRKAMSASSES